MTDPIPGIEARHAAMQCDCPAPCRALYSDFVTLLAEVKRLRNAADPIYDGTDAAHPAWWRGMCAGATAVAQMVTEILDGKDNGSGVMYAPMEALRRRVLALRAERDELLRNRPAK